MLLSVRALNENGTVITWRSIADAQPGSTIHNQMIAWALKVKAVPDKVWFTFNHEPEFVGNLSNGSDQDFIDAWRAFHQVFTSQGVQNAEFVWIMTDYSFEVPSSDRRFAQKWYPGDSFVDHLGADPYNYFNCRPDQPVPWKSLEESILPFRQFGSNHPDKGLILAEWASTETGGNKASWINDAAALFQRAGWEQFIAISYFNDIDPSHSECNWPVTSSAASLGAFTTMAHLPFYSESENP
jgi:hypothetical protein